MTRPMVVIRRANLERFTATLVTGIIASVTLVVATEWTQKKRPGEITLEQKITALTKNLNDSARAISEVEREVQARRQLADKLRADAEEAQNLATLNQKQVEAVAQALRGQLEERERASFWWTIGQNFFFAALGVALSEVYRWIVRQLRPQKGPTVA
jgi:arginine/ornithine N-succinyltransferase beta subunit